VGIDIESLSIEYAKKQYPDLEFHACDICEVGAKFPNTFDLIYLFNAFYAFDDKELAMQNLRRVAKTGARLCLFDYVYYKPEIPMPEVMLTHTPPTLERFSELFKTAHWELSKTQHLDQKYIEWYRNFLSRFDLLAEKRAYTKDMIEAVRKKYSDLLHSLEQGTMGGVLLVAYAI
jgi:SAM-dependent methyltransferase